jgi:hypothetical protein
LLPRYLGRAFEAGFSLDPIRFVFPQQQLTAKAVRFRFAVAITVTLSDGQRFIQRLRGLVELIESDTCRRQRTKLARAQYFPLSSRLYLEVKLVQTNLCTESVRPVVWFDAMTQATLRKTWRSIRGIDSRLFSVGGADWAVQAVMPTIPIQLLYGDCCGYLKNYRSKMGAATGLVRDSR